MQQLFAHNFFSPMGLSSAMPFLVMEDFCYPLVFPRCVSSLGSCLLRSR